MMNVDVSILIGCYMQERWLDHAFWSATNQRFGGTFDVAIYHDHCSSGNGIGASWNRNRAIAAAAGKYIVLLDADDMLPVNYLQALWQAILCASSKTRKSAFAGCPVQFISGNVLERIGNLEDGIYALNGADGDLVKEVPLSAMFPRTALRFDQEVAVMEDWDFWLALGAAGYSYVHTNYTCLLKNNDGYTKTQREATPARQAAIDRMNKRYGTTLVLPEVVL